MTYVFYGRPVIEFIKVCKKCLSLLIVSCSKLQFILTHTGNNIFCLYNYLIRNIHIKLEKEVCSYKITIFLNICIIKAKRYLFRSGKMNFKKGQVIILYTTLVQRII